DIFANENVIIPKVSLYKGATNVELNATIQDGIIESNDDVVLSGKGNFDNVQINTDNTVSFETTGTIKKLESKNEQSKVNLGEDITIGEVIPPKDKNIEDIINGYENVKDQ